MIISCYRMLLLAKLVVTHVTFAYAAKLYLSLSRHCLNNLSTFPKTSVTS